MKFSWGSNQTTSFIMSATVVGITAMLALFGAALISASSMGEFGWVGPPTKAPTTKAPTTTTTAAAMTTTTATTAAAMTTTAATTTTRAPTVPSDDGDTDAGTDDAIKAVVDAFNNNRAAANAPALIISPALTERARTCATLFQYRYIDPVGSTDQDHEAYGKMKVCDAAEDIGTLEYFCIASSDTSSDPNSAARNCLVEWIDNEKPSFNRAEPKYKNETRHYTQIIWKGTTEVGCALSERMTQGLARDRRSLVCLFTPPGNVIVAYSPSVAFAQNVGLL